LKASDVISETCTAVIFVIISIPKSSPTDSVWHIYTYLYTAFYILGFSCSLDIAIKLKAKYKFWADMFYIIQKYDKGKLPISSRTTATQTIIICHSAIVAASCTEADLEHHQPFILIKLHINKSNITDENTQGNCCRNLPYYARRLW
jgi:hypothetical protein